MSAAFWAKKPRGVSQAGASQSPAPEPTPTPSTPVKSKRTTKVFTKTTPPKAVVSAPKSTVVASPSQARPAFGLYKSSFSRDWADDEDDDDLSGSVPNETNDPRIEDLQVQLSMKQQHNEELSRMISERDGHIARVKEDLDTQSQRFTQVKNDLDAKDETIAELKHDVHQKDALIREFKDSIDGFQKSIDEQANLISGLQKDTVSRKRLILRLGAVVNNQKGIIEKHEEEMDQREEYVTDIEDRLSLKEAELAEVRAKLRELEASSSTGFDDERDSGGNTEDDSDVPLDFSDPAEAFLSDPSPSEQVPNLGSVHNEFTAAHAENVASDLAQSQSTNWSNGLESSSASPSSHVVQETVANQDLHEQNTTSGNGTTLDTASSADERLNSSDAGHHNCTDSPNEQDDSNAHLDSTQDLAKASTKDKSTASQPTDRNVEPATEAPSESAVGSNDEGAASRPMNSLDTEDNNLNDNAVKVHGPENDECNGPENHHEDITSNDGYSSRERSSGSVPEDTARSIAENAGDDYTKGPEDAHDKGRPGETTPSSADTGSVEASLRSTDEKPCSGTAKSSKVAKGSSKSKLRGDLPPRVRDHNEFPKLPAKVSSSKQATKSSASDGSVEESTEITSEYEAQLPVFVTPETIKKVAPPPPAPKLNFPSLTTYYNHLREEKSVPPPPPRNPGRSVQKRRAKTNEVPEIDPSKDIRRMTKEQRFLFGNGPDIYVMMGGVRLANVPKFVFMQVSTKAFKYFTEHPDATSIGFPPGSMNAEYARTHLNWMDEMSYQSFVYSVSLTDEERYDTKNLAICRAARVLGIHNMYVGHFTRALCQRLRSGNPSLKFMGLVDDFAYPENDPIFDHLGNLVVHLRTKWKGEKYEALKALLKEHKTLRSRVIELERGMKKDREESSSPQAKQNKGKGKAGQKK